MPHLGAMVVRIERDILALARSRCAGARVLSFGATHSDLKHLAIWISTPTDADRDALRGDPTFIAALYDALRKASYPTIEIAGFAFESQETVDRDYGGNWWYAVK